MRTEVPKRKSNTETPIGPSMVDLTCLLKAMIKSTFTCVSEAFLVPCYLNGFVIYFAAPGRAPLIWQTRIQISIDVAHALVILNFVKLFSLLWLFGSA